MPRIAWVVVGCLAALFITIFTVGQLGPGGYGEVTAVEDGPAGNGVVVTVLSTPRPGVAPSVFAWRVDDTGTIPDRPGGAYAPGRPDARGNTEDCADADCYRVVTGVLGVEVSHDHGRTYEPGWQLTDEVYRKLAADTPDLGDTAQHLVSRAIVVHTVRGGHVVFVANGRDGLLYRDVQGVWHRLGTPAAGSEFRAPTLLATDPRPVDLSLGLALAVAACVLGAGVVTALGYAVRSPRRGMGVLLIAMLCGAVSYLATAGPDPGVLLAALLNLGALALGCFLAVLAVMNGVTRRSRLAV